MLFLNSGAMKKFLLFCLSISFFQTTAFSQSCLPEGITFTTQAQIDDFQVNHPGCTVIEGDVTIAGDDISDLHGISVLDSIFGNLDVKDNHLLSNMDGLDNLAYIGGYLFFYGNEGLINLSGLNNLTTVVFEIYIWENPDLTSLIGLENLSFANSLNILWNGSLVSLSGLEGLDSIGEDMVLSYNDLLADLSGLARLTSIGGKLQIEANYSLTSLAGLENVNIQSISELFICFNQNLSDCYIQGICDYLADPKGIINVRYNATGCDNPPEIAESCGITLTCLPFGNYYFDTQAYIDSFPSYFSHCNQLTGYVNIEGEDIVNLDSLSGIDTINGSLMICGNENLSSLAGLNNIKTIQGYLSIGGIECWGNSSLTNLEGLNNLTSVGYSISVAFNSDLLTLSGLDSLSSVGHSVWIENNPSLKNLHGLESLASASSIFISGNNSIINLNGLSNLINIDGSIRILDNPVLNSIYGIANINAEDITALIISQNDILSTCDVRSVCDYLSDPGGSIEILENAPGCNSQEEVELACGVGVEEVVSQQSSVISYPNPVSSQTTFDVYLQNSAKVKLTVYNSMGQIVATILDEPLDKGEHLITWNAGNLSPGIYFYRLSTVNCQLSTFGKMVVVR
jgi:hypothetical protein